MHDNVHQAVAYWNVSLCFGNIILDRKIRTTYFISFLWQIWLAIGLCRHVVVFTDAQIADLGFGG